MAPGRTQAVADLGLYHPRNPRAYTPSGQLQTTSEHHHPAHIQLILHRGRRLVVSGHSQSLQPTSLVNPSHSPANSNQGSNKRSVYSAHTKGKTRVPSLGDRGGCATGPHRTPTTLGQPTKTRSHGSSTSYIDTNSGRMP